MNKYKSFGQLATLAFLNNASLPHFFSPNVAHYILGKEYNDASLEGLIKELPEDQFTVKEKLCSLQGCVVDADCNEALGQFDERFNMGINQATFHLDEKDSLIKMSNKQL